MCSILRSLSALMLVLALTFPVMSCVSGGGGAGDSSASDDGGGGGDDDGGGGDDGGGDDGDDGDDGETPSVETTGPFFAVPESEPNDTIANAILLLFGEAGTGDVEIAGDVDFWSFEAEEGDVVSIDLFATRFDQSNWSDVNLPRLTLYEPDGSTEILDQYYTSVLPVQYCDGWDCGWAEYQDLDIAAVRIPAAGMYYVAVGQDDPDYPGAGYAVLVRRRDFGSLQFEAEAERATGTNDSFNTAQAISPGYVHGFHVALEEDYFSFNVTEPSLVNFEVIGNRNGNFQNDDGHYDSYLTLYDSDGTTLLSNVDDCYYYDSCVGYYFSGPGTYYLSVSECCDEGDARYFLLFRSELAAPVSESELNDSAGTADIVAYGNLVTGTIGGADTADYFGFSGTAGDMVIVQRFTDWNYDEAVDDIDMSLFAQDGATPLESGGDGLLQQVTTILQSSGTFYLRVEPRGLETAYALSLTRFKAAQYETEPNDSAASAGTLDADGRAAGVLDSGDPADVFQFHAEASELVTFAFYQCACGADGNNQTWGWGSNLDGILTITDAQENVLAMAENDIYAYAEGTGTDSPDLMVSFVAPSAGTFYVGITDYSAGDQRAYYVLERR